MGLDCRIGAGGAGLSELSLIESWYPVVVAAFNMDNTVSISLVSAGGSVLVAIVALVLNHRALRCLMRGST
jgi:hypothetical protein